MPAPKILFTATVSRHLAAFHIPYLTHFHSLGYTVHTAAAGRDETGRADRHFDIPFSRNPISPQNLRAFFLLRGLLLRERYDVIHCHTPVAAALTRLAARGLRRNGTRVLYTCHGFHFFEGGPRLSGFIYRGAERLLSRFTDAVITIDREDFEALTRYRFKSKQCFLSFGVGADENRFFPAAPGEKAAARERFGIPRDAFTAVFAGDLNRNKNQGMLIEAASLLRDRVPELLLILPGEGPERERLTEQIRRLHLDGHVRLPGHCSDMPGLLRAADAALSSSLREGLGLNLVEAMLSGLPVAATRIRGHTDLIEDGKTGFLVPPGDAAAMADLLFRLYESPALREQMGLAARQAAGRYSLACAKARMLEIYEQCLGPNL